MTVNINRKSKIRVVISNSTIGTVDITEYVENVRAGYSPIDLPRQSVTYMTGVMVLKQTNTSLDFDDRYSTNWTRGTQISMFTVNPITQASVKLPICGTCFIFNAQYDLKETLTIQFGDLLGLLNYRTALQQGICIDLDQTTSISSAVFNLLKAAGVPNVWIDNGSIDFALNGNLVEPLFLNGNQSYIQTAATLCSRHDGLLFATKTGLIQAIRPGGGSVILDKDARDIQVYQRANAPESAIKKATFTWRNATVSEQSSQILDTTTTADTETLSTIDFDFNARTVTRTTTESRTPAGGGPKVFVSSATLVETYEPEPVSVIDANPLKTLDQCFPEDNARIVSTLQTDSTDNTQLLAAYLATQSLASAPNKNSFAPVVGVVNWKTTSEDYTYTPATGTPTKVEKITKLNIKRGFIAPQIGDRRLDLNGTDGGTGIYSPDLDPDTLIPFEYITETWLADEEDATYTYYRERWELVKSLTADSITNQALDPATTIQSIADNLFLFVKTEAQEIPNQQLPNFQTMPPQYITTYEEGELTIGTDAGSGTGFEVVAEFNLGDFLDFSDFDKGVVANQTIAQINGRINSMTITDDLFNISIENWGLILPTFRAVIQEPNINRRDTYSSYKIDSPSISFNQKEMVVGFVGILEGYLDGITDKNLFVSDPNANIGLLQTPATLPPF